MSAGHTRAPSRSFTLSTSIVLLCVAAGLSGQQPAGKPQLADGRVRSELSLGGRTTTIAFDPTLRADDPAHRSVLAASGGATGGRVKVAELETNGTLRLGTVDLGTPDPAGGRFELWLERPDSDWQLAVTSSTGTAAPAPGAADTGAIVGRITLPRRASTVASPTFAAALLPEGDLSGRLMLRWGAYETTTDIDVVNQLRRRTTERTEANVTTNRRHDEDTSALSRARLLDRRNESALVLATGARLAVSFARTFPRRQAAPTSPGLGIDGPDFAHLLSTPDGSVVQLTESAVPRLRVEAPLRFGNVLVATGNQVPGFPGAYGLWLKRVGNGWRLVFNHEPDVWGTQHEPKADAAEIALTYSAGHAASRPFGVGLAPATGDRGRLVIVWGPHEWSADFTVGR